MDHSESYVNGEAHTNGLENFWSLFKRAVKGTYVAIAPFHVGRYVTEEAFRFNNRLKSDFGRFFQALSQVVGKRLTYRTGSHRRFWIHGNHKTGEAKMATSKKPKGFACLELALARNWARSKVEADRREAKRKKLG